MRRADAKGGCDRVGCDRVGCDRVVIKVIEYKYNIKNNKSI